MVEVSQSRKILLLGSGFVAGPCLEYLARNPKNKITVACRTLKSSQQLASPYPKCATAIALDVTNLDKTALTAEIEKNDLIISLIPYIHHCKVIKLAIEKKKHVVTTSYISPEMMAYDEAAKKAGVTIMNEIGVDPGIDHLYALKTIHAVHDIGGKILSFKSYCGGLPAPECSNNPLGYKFSWSSRGVLLALRNNAKILQDGKVVDIPGPKLMDTAVPLEIYPAFAFEGYPNRDSTPYDVRYNIPEAHTIIRGTLRYKGFPVFVKSLVDIGFLDETPIEGLEEGKKITWIEIMSKLLSQKAAPTKTAPTSESLMQTTKAFLLTKGRTQADADRIVKGMKWLGLFSDEIVDTKINYLDQLCAALERKMMYEEGERDMVMLQHVFECELKDGSKQTRTSTGLWFGVPNGATAMATTVGVPCAIAVELILDGKLTDRGVVAPMTRSIVYPLIEALEKEGIKMVDEIL